MATINLVSPIGGVIAWVRPPMRDGVPDGWLDRTVRVASAGRGRHPDQIAPLLSAGVGSDATAAANDAVRRVAARYAASGWDLSAMRWASADELGDEAVAVEELPRVAPLETRDRIRWVEGFALDDGRPMWVPAVLAFVGLTPSVEAESFWFDTDGGLAVGDGLGDAVRAGLLDCIARDAFARILVADRALDRIEADGVAVFDATSDVGVPVALAAADGFVGWAASGNLADAARRAADDLVRRRAQPVSAWWSSPTSTDVDPRPAPEEGDVALDKPSLVAHLRAVSAAGYAVDLTTDELADVGLAAARVIVPGLAPLPPAPLWADHPRLQT